MAEKTDYTPGEYFMPDNPEIKVNTSDQTRYLSPKESDEKLGQYLGDSAVVIPHAASNGVSKGLSHERPGRIVIDPGRSNIEVDMAAVSTQQWAQALKTAGAGGAEQVFRTLEAAQKSPAPVVPTTKAAAPVSRAANPVTPTVSQSFVPHILPAAAALNPNHQEQPMSQPLYQQPNIHIMQLIESLQQQNNSLFQQLHSLRTPPVMPDPVLPIPQENCAGTVTIAEFPVLDIPFLDANAGHPCKPGVEVVFQSKAMKAVFAAKYHEVLVIDDILVVVYDTRYEEGMQFLPVEDPENVLNITVKRKGSTAVSGEYISLGIDFQLGVLAVSVFFAAKKDG